MSLRWGRLLLSGMVGLAAAGCSSAPSSRPAGEYRTVLLDGHPAACAEVLRTTTQQQAGLMGDHPPAAGAFVNNPPARPSLWMHDVHQDLVAVWVGASGRVLGSVPMRADTDTLHPAPAPVPLVLEISPGVWSHWSSRAHTASLGGRC